MSKEFENWFNNNPYSYLSGKSDMLMGWEACRQKVLEIIEKHKSETSKGSSVIFIGYRNRFVEEIEEL